jgi:hypothetical protein
LLYADPDAVVAEIAKVRYPELFDLETRQTTTGA